MAAKEPIYRISSDTLIKRPGKITHFDLPSGVRELLVEKDLVKHGVKYTEPKISLNNQEFHESIDIYKKESIVNFLDNVTRMHTIGDGGCSVHAIFGSMVPEYREINNESHLKKLIRLIENFRSEILVDFYERGWTTNRIDARGNRTVVSNDEFIMRNSNYLEDIDLRKISEVCHINIILIGFTQDPATGIKSGYNQFISGLELISLEDIGLIHKDWPVILMYNTGGHYETCKYQPDGMPGRYILDYSELPEDFVRELVASQSSAEVTVRLQGVIPDDLLDFLVGQNVKIIDREDGPWKVCAFDRYTDPEGKQYVSGLRLENISRNYEGRRVAGIVPLRFIDFSGLPLTEEQSDLIAELIANFPEIDIEQAPGGLFLNEANLGRLISEPRDCGKVKSKKTEFPTNVKDFPPQPRPSADAKFYQFKPEGVDESNTRELLRDILQSPKRFNKHGGREEAIVHSDDSLQRPQLRSRTPDKDAAALVELIQGIRLSRGVGRPVAALGSPEAVAARRGRAAGGVPEPEPVPVANNHNNVAAAFARIHLPSQKAVAPTPAKPSMLATVMAKLAAPQKKIKTTPVDTEALAPEENAWKMKFQYREQQQFFREKVDEFSNKRKRKLTDEQKEAIIRQTEELCELYLPIFHSYNPEFGRKKNKIISDLKQIPIVEENLEGVEKYFKDFSDPVLVSDITKFFLNTALKNKLKEMKGGARKTRRKRLGKKRITRRNKTTH